MTRHRVSLVVVALVVAVATADVPQGVTASQTTARMPERLSDQEFWRLASGFSEPDGTFHSENLVSNEIRFQQIVPALMKTVVPGRAYLGVGSEQNFTYIAATRPAMAFIVDIRRGNFDLHLLYKTLFELSADRADFVSRMFSRPRPPGLGPSSTPAQIFASYAAVAPDAALFAANLRAVVAHLEKRHGFGLLEGDREGIAFVYNAWFTGGPDIAYELTTGFGRGGGRGRFPTYADLMMATDDSGAHRSYLATEASFAAIKSLQTRNLVVPVVGNFGGPKAIRAVGAYLRQRRAVVSAFYVSNVEQYLERDGLWGAFCANAATLPVDDRSVFIRSWRGGFAGARGAVGPGGGFALELAPIAAGVEACAVR